jgi:hypothetical protein
MQRDILQAQTDEQTDVQFGARQMAVAGSEPAPWGLPKSPFGAQNKGIW